jgi:hypothetical protein
MLEEIKSMLQTLLEGQQSLASIPERMTSLENTIQRETQLWRELWHDHEARITKLETS